MKTSKPRWHVLTHIGNEPENCWTDEKDGITAPTTFATKREALAELKSYLDDCRKAVKDGDMSDAPKRSEFTIERVKA